MWKVLGNSETEKELLLGDKQISRRGKPLLCGRFELGTVMKHGATGTLYFGKVFKPKATGCLKINERLVLKTEDTRCARRQILTEWQVYTALSLMAKKGVCFPTNVGGVPRAELEQGRVFQEDSPGEGKGEVTEVKVLAMEALGENLMMLMQKMHSQKLSLKSVLLLGIQMISLLETLHKAGFVHRDLKPENFCVGSGEKSGLLYLIDFGVAQLFRDPTTQNILPQYGSGVGEGKRFPGSLRYASLFAHEGGRQTPRADCEAVAFVLVYLLKGRLPWQGAPAKTAEALREEVKRLKMAHSAQSLCGDCPALVEYLEYCRSLSFEDIPNYDYLKQIFRSWLQKRGLANDGTAFEWQRSKEKPYSVQEPYMISIPKQKPSMHSAQKGEVDLYADMPEVASTDPGSKGNVCTSPTAPQLGKNEPGVSEKPVPAEKANLTGKNNALEPMAPEEVTVEKCWRPAPFSPKHTSLTPVRPSLKRKRQETKSATQAQKAVKFAEAPLVIMLEKLGPAEPWGVEMEKAVLKRDSTQEEMKLDEMMQKWQKRMEQGKGIDGTNTLKGKTHWDDPGSATSVQEAKRSKKTVMGEDGQVNVTAALCRIVPHLMKPKKFQKASKLLEQLLVAQISHDNADEFADALGASLGTGNFLHNDATWKSYASLFSCALEKLSLFSEERKGDVALWICAAFVFNTISKDGLTETNAEDVIEKLKDCIHFIDSSRGASAVAKEILIARVYDCLEKLYENFRMTWSPKQKILNIFSTAVEMKSFTKLQKNSLTRWFSTIQARL